MSQPIHPGAELNPAPSTPGAAPQPAPLPIYAYALTGPVELTLYARATPGDIARELLSTPILLRHMSTIQADTLASGICRSGRVRYASGNWEIARGGGVNHYYLHRKTGGIYRVLAQEYHRGEGRQAGDVVMPYYGVTETWESPYIVTDAYPDGALVVFYENAVTGQRWARDFEMFGDGRFVEFEKPPLEAIAALKAAT